MVVGGRSNGKCLVGTGNVSRREVQMNTDGRKKGLVAYRPRVAGAVAALLLVGACMLIAEPRCRGAQGTQPAQTGPKYLLFQIGTADTAILGHPETPHVAPKADIARQVEEIVSHIGQVGDHVKAQLGVVVGPMSWDLTDDQLRSTIRNAFEVAEDKDVAVGFHIEDSMFWNKRKDLWSDKNNVEWSDWKGTVVPHRLIGWAGNGAPILAPPMCYNSPAIQKEATRLARDVIGAELKKGVDHLKSVGKPYLFAGVIAGWETRMQDDSHHPAVYYGYCALKNLGFSEDKPPADIDEALQGVVRDWVILWTKGLRDAGLAREKVFTHIAFPGENPEQVLAQLRRVYEAPSLLRDFYKNSDPNVTAFNDFSCPGFSVYGAGNYPSLHRILSSHGSPPWGVAEGTAITLADAFRGGARPVTPTMERYLAGVFNHGGTFVNLFGWNTRSGERIGNATTGLDAIGVYREFLRGEKLSEGEATKASDTSGGRQAPGAGGRQ